MPLVVRIMVLRLNLSTKNNRTSNMICNVNGSAQNQNFKFPQILAKYYDSNAKKKYVENYFSINVECRHSTLQ